MNLDRIEGNWKQLKGNIQQQWGWLTDDQLEVVLGKRQNIAGRIQEIYGIAKDQKKATFPWRANRKSQPQYGDSST